jgi:hypothetical protein
LKDDGGPDGIRSERLEIGLTRSSGCWNAELTTVIEHHHWLKRACEDAMVRLRQQIAQRRGVIDTSALENELERYRIVDARCEILLTELTREQTPPCDP